MNYATYASVDCFHSREGKKSKTLTMVINRFRGIPDKFTLFRNQSHCFLIFTDVHKVLNKIFVYLTE